MSNGINTSVITSQWVIKGASKGIAFFWQAISCNKSEFYCIVLWHPT